MGGGNRKRTNILGDGIDIENRKKSLNDSLHIFVKQVEYILKKNWSTYFRGVATSDRMTVVPGLNLFGVKRILKTY